MISHLCVYGCEIGLLFVEFLPSTKEPKGPGPRYNVYRNLRGDFNMSGLLCPFCGERYEATMTRFLIHVRLYHADSPNFSIRCNLQECNREFKNFYTYRNHVYAIHGGKDTILDENPGKCGNTITAATDHATNGATNHDIDPSVEEPQLPQPQLLSPSPQLFPEEDPSAIQRAAATWILKVRETNLLPQSTIEAIIKDTESMYMVSPILLSEKSSSK